MNNAVSIAYFPASPACGGRSSAGYCVSSTSFAVLPASVHPGMVILSSHLIVNLVLCGTCKIYYCLHNLCCHARGVVLIFYEQQHTRIS